MLGRLGDLMIYIRSYEPSLDCDPRPSKASSQRTCQDALFDTPAGTGHRTFGTNRLDPKVTYLLPREFNLGKLHSH